MRKFGFVAAIIVGVLIVAVIVIYFSVDAIARYALRKEGTSLMGVSTTASAVDLGIFRRSTTITDLVIDNPPGFNKPHLLQVDEMYIEGRLGTFTSSDIEIPLVQLKGFTFDLEQIKNRVNVEEVVGHITKEVGSDDNSGGDVKLNIARLEITDIQLTAEGRIVNLTGGKLDVNMSRIELADVGTETDPDKLLGHVVGILMKVVLDHIAENPIKGLSNLALGQISNSISEIPGLKQVGLGRPIGDAVQAVGKGAAGAVSGIGDAIQGIGHTLRGNRNASKGGNENASKAGNKNASSKGK